MKHITNKYIEYYENGIKVIEEVTDYNERQLKDLYALLKANPNVTKVKKRIAPVEQSEREFWKGWNIDELIKEKNEQ